MHTHSHELLSDIIASCRNRPLCLLPIPIIHLGCLHQPDIPASPSRGSVDGKMERRGFLVCTLGKKWTKPRLAATGCLCWGRGGAGEQVSPEDPGAGHKGLGPKLSALLPAHLPGKEKFLGLRIQSLRRGWMGEGVQTVSQEEVVSLWPLAWSWDAFCYP